MAGFSYGITLDEVLQLASQNNKELQSLRQQIQSAQLQLEADRNLQYPQFFARVSASSFLETPMTVIPGFPVAFRQANKQFTNINAGISQVLYSGGQIGSRIEISKYNLEALKALYREKESQIKAETAKAYIDVFVADSLVKIYTGQKQALEAVYRQAEGFFEAGLITRVDILQTKVRLSEVQKELTLAQSRRKVAVSRLSQLTGTDMSGEVFSPVDLQPQQLPEFETLLTSAYRSRGILDYYTQSINQAQKMEVIEKSEMMPKLFAQAEYTYTSQNPYLDPRSNVLLTVGASIQVQALSSHYRVLRAKSDTSKLRYDLENIKENIKLELKTAYEEYIAAAENHRVARDNLAYAEEYFELVKQQYENQLATSTDLLNAESSLTRARQNLEITKYDMLKAYIEILRITGQY